MECAEPSFRLGRDCATLAARLLHHLSSSSSDTASAPHRPPPSALRPLPTKQMADPLLFHSGPIESAIAASIATGRSLACFISGNYAPARRGPLLC